MIKPYNRTKLSSKNVHISLKLYQRSIFLPRGKTHSINCVGFQSFTKVRKKKCRFPNISIFFSAASKQRSASSVIRYAEDDCCPVSEQLLKSTYSHSHDNPGKPRISKTRAKLIGTRRDPSVRFLKRIDDRNDY